MQNDGDMMLSLVAFMCERGPMWRGKVVLYAGDNSTVRQWVSKRQSGSRAGRLLVRALNLREMNYGFTLVGGWWRTYHNVDSDYITRCTDDEFVVMLEKKSWTKVELGPAISKAIEDTARFGPCFLSWHDPEDRQVMLQLKEKRLKRFINKPVGIPWEKLNVIELVSEDRWRKDFESLAPSQPHAKGNFTVVVPTLPVDEKGVLVAKFIKEALWLSCFDGDLDTEEMPEVTMKEYFKDTSAGGRRPKSVKPAQLPADQYVLLEPRKIPFDGSVQTHVEEWLEENIARSKAATTLRMYQSAWGKWEAWAARQGWPSCYLNVKGDKLENEDKLLAFLGYLGWLGTTAASIKQALFAVKDGHKRGGAGDPTEGMFRVWMLVTSLDRHAERKPRRLGVTPGMLVWVGKSLCNSDLFGEDQVDKAMVQAALLVAWFFMLRAKEYCDSGGVDAHMIIRGMDVRLTKNGGCEGRSK
eukprot:g13470.t1